MKNAMKKLMAFVLVAVMLVGALPFAAFATEGEPVAQAESYKVTMAVNWPDGTSAFAAQEKPIQYASASAQSLLTAYFTTGYNEIVSISVNGTNVGTDTSYMVPSGANVVFVVSNCRDGHIFAEGPCDQVKTCTRHCGTTQPAGTHTWDAGQTTTAAVCVTSGVKTYTCTVANCGATKTETIPAPANQHTWNPGVVTTEPTCIATGVKTYTCTVTGCGATKTETVPAAGHTWVAASCTAPKTCSVCHTVDSEALGHALRETITPATCTAPGEKVSKCAVCNYEVKETIPALGHAPGANGKCTRSGCTYEEALRYNVNYYLNYDNNFTPKTETVYKGHSVYNYIPSRYGYDFAGWYTAAGTRVADNATVTSDSAYYARWTQVAPKEVYVRVYINGNTSNVYAIVDLYEWAQDHVITKADIEAAIAKHGLKAYNKAGLSVYGPYTPAQWNSYCLDDYYRNATERVAVDQNEKTVIYAMVHNVQTSTSSSSGSKADSSNPKTGDMIFAPMMVLGASASCLAVLFYLNKKRAI